MDKDNDHSSDFNLQENELLIEFESDKKELNLSVEEFKDDLNFLKIHGSPESLKKIFRDLIDGLDSRKHSDHEVEDDWQYVTKRQHLRPGGTYMVTVDNREEIWL